MAADKKVYIFKITDIVSRRSTSNQWNNNIIMKDFDDKQRISFSFITNYEVIDMGNLSVKVIIPEED